MVIVAAVARERRRPPRSSIRRVFHQRDLRHIGRVLADVVQRRGAQLLLEHRLVGLADAAEQVGVVGHVPSPCHAAGFWVSPRAASLYVPARAEPNCVEIGTKACSSRALRIVHGVIVSSAASTSTSGGPSAAHERHGRPSHTATASGSEQDRGPGRASARRGRPGRRRAAPSGSGAASAGGQDRRRQRREHEDVEQRLGHHRAADEDERQVDRRRAPSATSAGDRPPQLRARSRPTSATSAVPTKAWAIRATCTRSFTGSRSALNTW